MTRETGTGGCNAIAGICGDLEPLRRMTEGVNSRAHVPAIHALLLDE